MNPKAMRDELEARHGPAPTGTTTSAPPPSAMRAGAPAPAPIARSDLYETISGSYFTLRRGLALLALAFPVLLWLVAGPEHLQASISAYYHYHGTGAGPSPFGSGSARDVFVGVLWAIGAFLFFYRGYSRREDIALDIAGLAALLISTFPMDWPDDVGSLRNTIHFTSAVIFFLAVAYVCLFRPGDTLALLRDPVSKRRFKRSYALLGTLMIAVPVSILAVHFLADWLRLIPERSDENRWVFWVEVAGIYVFAA
ncbi:MAG TPA: hypothetical protein VF574_00665 [Allosphingosinicella sp.]|jgi:hypothetical protein